MQIHGRNSGGWRISWWKAGAQQRWLLTVWPHEALVDGRYPTEHPMWREEADRPVPAHRQAFASVRQCEAFAAQWIHDHREAA